MRSILACYLVVVLVGCNRPHKISDEYPPEMSAVAKVEGQGLPYLVGEDLRPTWQEDGVPAPRKVSAFRLADQNGNAFSLNDLEDKVAVVAFFFSTCKGTCPLTTRHLKALQDRFKDKENFVLVSLSVMPEKDSPPVLKHFAQENGVHAKRWHLLTGTRKEIYALARGSFSADTFSAKENAIAPVGENDFLHSENVYLVDRKHRLRGVYAGIRPDSIEDLARDATVLLE